MKALRPGLRPPVRYSEIDPGYRVIVERNRRRILREHLADVIEQTQDIDRRLRALERGKGKR